MPTVISVMTALLFGFGAFTTVTSFKDDRPSQYDVKGAASQASGQTVSGGLPAEDEPKFAMENYQVPAQLPKFLTIEKLHVHARIQTVSAGLNRYINAPDNIFDVGWYEGGPKPGEQGAAVLTGHVSGPTKRGVFQGITSLVPGDKVSITRGDDSVLTYTVQEVKSYDNDKVDMDRIMRADQQALHIITSAGRFNIRTNQYEPRIAVFAVLET